MIESDKNAKVKGCSFDSAAADRAVKYIETYTFVPELGTRIIHLPSHRHFVRSLYGRKVLDGKHLCRRAILSLTKKCVKTIL